MLVNKIKNRQSGIITYGLTPPRAKNPPEKIASIAGKQMARIEALGVDGLVLYDIQDESSRTAKERPFPFMKTIDPLLYSREYLKELNLPRIIYRCVGNYTPGEFTEYLEQEKESIAVFVGAASRNQEITLSLKDAYRLKEKKAPSMLLGGVAIPERHQVQWNEHSRVLGKMKRGCTFFITQFVYNSEGAKNFLSDYHYTCLEEKIPPAPLLFTITPCGSLKTLEFMKWLGLSIPRWLENELVHSVNILEKSLELCIRVFKEVTDFCISKNLPFGCNVESVSTRKVEIEASVHLVEEMKRLLKEKGVRE